MVLNLTHLPAKTVSPVRLAHVVLRTTPENFLTMTEFYKKFLGGQASWENDVLSFITYDDEHHRIAIAALPNVGPRNPKTCGLEHISFTFNSLEELLVAYRQRAAQGVSPIWTVNHGVTVSMYYRDPDGNQLETQVDCFQDIEEINAYMTGPEMAENPLGVEFDPEEMIRKLQEGIPEAELLKRPSIGPRGLDDLPLIDM
ncbi:Glyoxalase/Bleomycin resistance protein/Dihydroxybiphenyl dioxygenase [Penicillium vulpinum]|uniref:VOC domain-containing protein n=1 Tax=Penicillium vulpinum TaxID=29845 RepID=A0A1V6RF08_9EURO|nr:Glyoxalase/Bleomycin resistance protein/Dihydroxybiphenyl dioxygenase [Penicillium vulpinum]KAJ5950517.1 Glyoxalase/Bleomycin resistance protein/Dihydroxybiphenyl dioxygenase [Penicillium vulpinum]OQE00381.1 hypothetical protein PENVUL_c053G02311 [Penicillium vulpinum]